MKSICIGGPLHGEVYNLNDPAIRYDFCPKWRELYDLSKPAVIDKKFVISIYEKRLIYYQLGGVDIRGHYYLWDGMKDHSDETVVPLLLSLMFTNTLALRKD